LNEANSPQQINVELRGLGISSLSGCGDLAAGFAQPGVVDGHCQIATLTAGKRAFHNGPKQVCGDQRERAYNLYSALQS
jgi:hypothetical protein